MPERGTNISGRPFGEARFLDRLEAIAGPNSIDSVPGTSVKHYRGTTTECHRSPPFDYRVVLDAFSAPKCLRGLSTII